MVDIDFRQRTYLYINPRVGSGCRLGKVCSILRPLFVAVHSPITHYKGKGRQYYEVMRDALHVAAADKDGADAVDEIMHRVNVGGDIRPVGHRPYGREESAK